MQSHKQQLMLILIWNKIPAISITLFNNNNQKRKSLIWLSFWHLYRFMKNWQITLSCIYLLSMLALFSTCSNKTDQQFEKISTNRTNIEFVNQLQFREDFDVFRYRNYYNGGGVAIGDVNGDGLADIYLSANMLPNKLYLNKGDFKFEDITAKSGVAGNKEWSTGVVMADVNGDGHLDIYVCNSGDMLGGKRENELFINQGNQTFSEQAAKYGLDDKGFSTHAAFFDYDQDGDLDCYMLNNSFRPVSSLGYENIRHLRDSTGGDKLYENRNGYFVDVSEEAGIYGSVIGFGLGVTVSDVDQDGWLDIYVSNDFFERDYLYINQQDGTFRDELTERMGHISNFSMGTDAADLNNDGFPEIFVTDMLPKDESRMKTMVNFESYDVHQIKLQNDYYEQFMRNTLQLNRRDGTFSEIAQFAGVQATDWSWGALLADFDNDLNKEIYVTNGIYKDVIDQDFINYLANEENMVAAMRAQKVNFENLVDKMPSQKLSNFLFKKRDSLQYQNVANGWGLDEPSFSNAAAYGDLDNDGDLDLVVNNVNMKPFVYRNSATQKKKNYLKISFRGPDKNPYGVGANVKIFANGHQLLWENIPTKGFQASMDYNAVIGLDTLIHIDSLLVLWGYGKRQKLLNLPVNQHITIDIDDAEDYLALPSGFNQTIFQQADSITMPAFKHQENRYIDFNNERLLYHQLSKEGPAMAAADLNGDGLDDMFVGGATGHSGKIILQNSTGFTVVELKAFEQDAIQEDVDAAFFDADGDGDQDLYVVSGGYSFNENAREYQDRLYLNIGKKGNIPVFSKAGKHVPLNYTMNGCVRPADFDGDGDIDLFVGGRAIPAKYGMSPNSQLLVNQGDGQFKDETNRLSMGFNGLGMVTDATWLDYDSDEDLDLVVVGEWMPIVLFKNNGTNLERLNNVPGLTQTEGWWRSIYPFDINQDGNMDFIAGNFGLNSRYSTRKEQPFTMFLNDFDKNGIMESIYAYYHQDSLYPMALRHDMIGQMPSLKKKYVHYHQYAGQSVSQIFSPALLEESYQNKIYQLASVAIINHGDGHFSLKQLPPPVQWSPVYTILAFDFNRDDKQELFIGGNFSGVKPEEGRYDANKGILLSLQNQEFQVIDHRITGLNITGDMKKSAVLKSTGSKQLLVVARNNQELAIYEF